MHWKFCLPALGMVFWAGLGAPTARAQQHVVSVDELHSDAQRNSEKRQADEAAVRDLLSSEAGQKALKAANVEYQKVDKAIEQLSDEDLARIAARSEQVESDFAAGSLPGHILFLIILILILIIVLSVTL
jgi:hypothetical protein